MPHRRLIRSVPLAAFALALVAACGAGALTSPSGGGPGVPTAPPSTSMTDTPRSSLDLHRSPGPSPHVDASILPVGLLAAIVADAAIRTRTQESEVVLTHAERITWPDGSLGCPVPGNAYTQSLVPGSWVIVEAGGSTLDYRASDRGGFTLCEKPGPRPSASAGS